MEDQEGICKLTFDYFVGLFASILGHCVVITSKITSRVLNDDNCKLSRLFSCEEFKETTFQMLLGKAIDPYGFNLGFYHHFWNTYGEMCLWLDASGSQMVFFLCC